MVKPVRFDESGDSEDLQALFDSIAAGSIAPEPPPSAPDNAGDSEGFPWPGPGRSARGTTRANMPASSTSHICTWACPLFTSQLDSVLLLASSKNS